MLVLFDFGKPDWVNFPLIVEQISLPYGIKQVGSFLELILDEVGIVPTSSTTMTLTKNHQKRSYSGINGAR